MVHVRLAIFAVIGLCTFHETLAGQKLVVDVSSDLSYGWKVSGEYIYIPRGEQLSEFRNKLPARFPFDSISNTRGIWVILPRSFPNSTISNVALSTNIVTFSYSASAQLLDFVTIKHNSGGHSMIKIIAKQNYTQTPEQMFPNWMEITVPVEGKNRFSIELTATTEQDYILIDRIEATFMETSTSTRRPRSSTPKPLPSGQQSFHGSVCLALAGILLVYVPKSYIASIPLDLFN